MTEETRPYDDAHAPGTPPGMEPQDIEDRFEVGRWFGKEIWPAPKSDVLAKAAEMGAPDDVMGRLQRLPAREYRNTQDVIAALGIGVEQHRP